MNCDVMSFLKKKLTSKEKMKEEFTEFVKYVDRKYKNGLFDKLFTLTRKTYKGFMIGNKEIYFFTNTGIRFYSVVLPKKEISWKVVGDDTVILSNIEDWIYLKDLKNEIRNVLDD